MTKKSIRQTMSLLIVLCCFLAANHTTANDYAFKNDAITQQTARTITGKVTDSDDEPLPGVYVFVRGTTNGTTTDVNGNYSITVPGVNAVLSFSYIGFTTYEITVGNRRFIDVLLEDDAHHLDEVIVTGFGNLKKSQYDGSASLIKTDNMAGIPNLSVASIIQANAPGVEVTSSSSQPGGVSTLRIRGYGSFNASNSPLYVIDGIPVMSGDFNQTGRSASGGTDIMETLNPNDISNITVIKDAAAASLWGSRAANGVILITTKQGDKNRMRVSFSADFGSSNFAYRYRPVMGGEERKQFIYDAYVRKGRYVDNLSEADAVAYANSMADADSKRARPYWSVTPWSGWTDWISETFRKGTHNNQEVSVSGGSDRTTYYSSFSRTNTKGLQLNQELDRLTGRINVTYKANDWLRMGGNMLFSDMNQSLGRDDNWYSAPMYAAYVKNTPADPVYNQDGTYNTVLIGGTSRNPIAVYEYNINKQRLTRAFNTVYMEAQPLKELTFKTTLSYDFTININTISAAAFGATELHAYMQIVDGVISGQRRPVGNSTKKIL